MSIDVLAYNALNADNKVLRAQSAALQSTITTTNTSISNLNTCIASLQSTCATAISNAATAAVSVVANAGPNQAHLWCLIPTLPATGCPWTTGFKVCDTTDHYQCGRCCAWTVPGGVTCARFQIWGAGGGTGFICCCGWTPFGGTGAYASVIIPVTAGNTYTLCGGCAYCCCATAGGKNDVAGSSSYVTGTNLSNFCAQGGEASIWCQMQTRCKGRGVMEGGYCMWLGGCVCTNQNSVCWTPSASSTQGGVGSPGCCFDYCDSMISSCKIHYGSSTGGSGVYGIRGSFGAISPNCNSTVRVQSAPIYGFPNESCCCCILTNNYAGGWCRGGRAGYMRIPGAGGFALFHCGGGNSNAGDRGRFGMVCVSYL